MESTPYPKPINPTQTRVGWIGIGVMGAAMASRVLKAGYSLTVYARNRTKASQLESLGAQIADSPVIVAKSSNLVFTMVGYPSDVKAVLLSADGVLSGLSENSVMVDSTSSSPELAREIAGMGREKGCWAVDAPVSGGDVGARDGKLAILAGGDSGVVDWLKPLFDLMGKVTYVGPAGSGQSCKIGNQIMVTANLVGMSEGLVFAQRAGLDLEKFKKAIECGAAGSKVMELFGDRMIGRDFEAGAFVEYMVKDLGMGLDGFGVNSVVVLPGAALCKHLLLAMVANGDGKMGIQGLVTAIERLNGK